ncbi:MAG: FtsH protease activity modulator HflK [Alphaproteobacteria bacterium]|nr:FtsH protease activity modulator HflK [Alphaproteobacteria bacterium]
MALNSGGGGPWGGGSGGSGGGSGGGGGPWGSGGGGNNGGWGGNPWGRGNGPGGQMPDLDDLIRKGRDRFNGLFSNGFKGIGVLAAILVAGWLATGLYRVQPDEQGVVVVFGQWTDTTQPGLHYNWPSPIGKVYKPKVTRSNRVEVGFRSTAERSNKSTSVNSNVNEESLMLTGDENIVDIDFIVLWKIKDAGQFLFKIRDPQGTVKVAAESAMREVISQTPIQMALTEGRRQVEQQTRGLLQDMLDSYESGIEVMEVQMQKSDPPAQVVDAFNDVQRAKADRERLSNEAEAYRNDIIPKARGDAEKLLQESQAYKEQVVNIAQGEASRFLSVYNAYVKAPNVTSQRIYYENIEQILHGTNKLIIDPSAAKSGVLPYLPLNELKAKPEGAQGGKP